MYVHSYIHTHTYEWVTPQVHTYMHTCTYIHTYARTNTHAHIKESCHTNIHIFVVQVWIQDGEDSKDPLSCRSFSTKEPLNIGHFCGNWPIKIRDPMSLRHPVFVCWISTYVRHERVDICVLDIHICETWKSRYLCVGYPHMWDMKESCHTNI